MTNVAVYRLENTGRAQVAVTLPPEARFWRIILDGSEWTPESSGKPPRPIFVRLPRDLRFPTLRIHYAVPHPATQIVGQLQPDWPAIDVPCFRQTWSVWLPPAFAAWSKDSRAPYDVEQRNSVGPPTVRVFAAASLRAAVQPVFPGGLAGFGGSDRSEGTGGSDCRGRPGANAGRLYAHQRGFRIECRRGGN